MNSWFCLLVNLIHCLGTPLKWNTIQWRILNLISDLKIEFRSFDWCSVSDGHNISGLWGTNPGHNPRSTRLLSRLTFFPPKTISFCHHFTIRSSGTLKRSIPRWRTESALTRDSRSPIDFGTDLSREFLVGWPLHSNIWGMVMVWLELKAFGLDQ